ncbi:LysE family translocator [Gordonia liuliyuniae]|uniref:LysE family transporter n=1 Tax=Gordonia liuliyuniae TaxID=2911517 RepID=A0ABS9IRL2_9ACTN|nr:LysE family transporter [Gordonia liuliyuniae]MCF8588176.1 LysE family transporter [Gordonia liuliyuniae]
MIRVQAGTVACACYVGWLGWGALRDPPAPEVAVAAASGASWKSHARTGFGVSALNPKVLLLFVALLPQFTSASSPWPIGVQIVCLGVVHVASTAVVYSAVAGGAGRALRARPALARTVGRVSGVVMMIVAIVLVVEQAVV